MKHVLDWQIMSPVEKQPDTTNCAMAATVQTLWQQARNVDFPSINKGSKTTQEYPRAIGIRPFIAVLQVIPGVYKVAMTVQGPLEQNRSLPEQRAQALCSACAW